MNGDKSLNDEQLEKVSGGAYGPIPEGGVVTTKNFHRAYVNKYYTNQENPSIDSSIKVAYVTKAVLKEDYIEYKEETMFIHHNIWFTEPIRDVPSGNYSEFLEEYPYVLNVN